VVAIGASAGGLQALEDLFENTPADIGMAFIVVSHQQPGRTSLLPELLGKHSSLQIEEASDGTKLAPNRVYVGPPGKYVGILKGRLHLIDTPTVSPSPLPIDYCFHSLAEDQQENAICIVLSGTGTDGTLGLRAVKANFGMAIVQDLQSARYAGMPTSAIATTLADYVLTPAAMPTQLKSYTQGAALYPRVPAELESDLKLEPGLEKVCLLLRMRTGHDFSGYKPTVMRRRIERRMAVHQVKGPGEYVRLLQTHPHELDVLFCEFLIGVTSYFRDAEAYQALRDRVIPALMERRMPGDTFRAWVPACGTGEEAYSIAILLREWMNQGDTSMDVQIFGTDLDGQAVETARLGHYAAGIEAAVPADLLARYFLKEESTYRVRKDLREMLIFAQQNIIKDPPFTRMDLISCRNLLIYFNAELQKRLIPIFHYSLKPGGVLMLGPSEGIGSLTNLFEPVEKKWRIFRRIEPPAGYAMPEIPAGGSGPRREAVVTEPAPHPPAKPPSITVQLQTFLLHRFAPPSVVVNERGDILFIHGRTGNFLEPGTGQPRLNVHDMAREGLAAILGAALREAKASDREILRPGVRVRTNGHFVETDLSVSKITEPELFRGHLLISFLPAICESGSASEADTTDGRKTGDERAAARVRDLEREVKYTKESLQTTVEELETSVEELKSTNEELQSLNEELQSTNEELETSKEETQSLNEELTTVNAELQSKVEDLSRANDDMQNLLNSTDIATLFLDNDLRIKRYTEQVKKLINLIPTDVGRPIGDLVSHFGNATFEADARSVLQTLASKQREVQSRDGDWYLMRMMPYRTAENAIKGLVATFVHIGRSKELEAHSAALARFFEDVFDTLREAVLVLDRELRVVKANRTFYSVFRSNREKTEGQLIYDVGGGEWDLPGLRHALEHVIPQQTAFEDFEVAGKFPKIGRREFLLNGRRLEQGGESPGMILLAMEERT
jgi:two-component system CheB/CheR fusion protein